MAFKAPLPKATSLIADSWGSLPTLGQADDLMSVDSEDHLLLIRQLDDEFQLLSGPMHQSEVLLLPSRRIGAQGDVENHEKLSWQNASSTSPPRIDYWIQSPA